MSQDLRIRYSVTVDDMVAWNAYHLKHSPAIRRAEKRQQLLFFAFILGGSIVADLLNGRVSWTPLGMIWVAFSYLFLRFLRIPLGRKYARWVYAHGQNRGVICEHTIEIMDDGIVETTDVNQNKAFWAGIDRIEESPDLGIIYVGQANAYIIPRKRVLEGDYESFMAELRKRFVQSLHARAIS